MEAAYMKPFGVLSTAVLFVLFGIAAPVYAQEPQEENKPAQHEEAKPAQDKPSQPEEAKPGERRDEGKPAEHRDEAKPGERQEQVKPEERREESRPEERREEKHPAVQQKSEQHGTRAGGRIPDDKFRAHFGREHKFQVGHPVIVEGQPRFQYAGYWFVLVEPWPVEWAYTDDVYIDYVDDEYYLFDLMRPGIRIAINVIM
jgi:hypothetical protein